MSRAFIVVSGIALLALVVGAVFVQWSLFDPFNFGPCDGHGPADREWLEYHENGKLRVQGTFKNCGLEGTLTTYYESGSIESRCEYLAGVKNGAATYFTPEGIEFKKENYSAGALVDVEIQDIEESVRFMFKDDTLKSVDANGTRAIAFVHPLTMHGNDQPFVSLHDHKLVLRGAQDLYMINPDLSIDLSLRDTLTKYIPSAYNEKFDASGNRFSFLWHRSIVDDTLRVKVFYDADQHQSNSKTWVYQYAI